MSSVNDHDVIIIGAGLAGLNCARLLRQTIPNIIVLEARSRIGGRVFTQQPDQGGAIDLGAQWVGPGQSRIERLANEAGLTPVITSVKGRHVTERSHAIGPAGLLDIVSTGFRIWRQVRKTSALEPWLRSNAAYLDRISIEEWLAKSRTEAGKYFWLDIVESEFCADPSAISALEVLHHISTANGLLAVTRAQRTFFEQGVGPIVTNLSHDLPICRDTPVSHIERYKDHVKVKTSSAVYTARQVVLALPPQIARTLIDDRLAVTLGLSQQYSTGSVIKTVLTYDSPWWRERGLSGVANSVKGPVGQLVDYTLGGSNEGRLIAFSAGRRVDLLTTNNELRNSAVARNVELLLGGDAPAPTSIVSVDWTQETFSQGGYSSTRPMNSWTEEGRAGLQRIGPVHLAGTESATEWRGYMEGALQSGERAATQVCKRRNRKISAS